MNGHIFKLVPAEMRESTAMLQLELRRKQTYQISGNHPIPAHLHLLIESIFLMQLPL